MLCFWLLHVFCKLARQKCWAQHEQRIRQGCCCVVVLVVFTQNALHYYPFPSFGTVLISGPSVGLKPTKEGWFECTLNAEMFMRMGNTLGNSLVPDQQLKGTAGPLVHCLQLMGAESIQESSNLSQRWDVSGPFLLAPVQSTRSPY